MRNFKTSFLINNFGQEILRSFLEIEIHVSNILRHIAIFNWEYSLSSSKPKVHWIIMKWGQIAEIFYETSFIKTKLYYYKMHFWQWWCHSLDIFVVNAKIFFYWRSGVQILIRPYLIEYCKPHSTASALQHN